MSTQDNFVLDMFVGRVTVVQDVFWGHFGEVILNDSHLV